MDMKEKLVELVNAVLRCLPWGEISSHTAEDVADHILADGWTKQEWISVKERLPEKPGLYLVATPYSVSCEYYHIPKYVQASFGLNEHKHERITHWMPRPQPPKGE